MLKVLSGLMSKEKASGQKEIFKPEKDFKIQQLKSLLEKKNNEIECLTQRIEKLEYERSILQKSKNEDSRKKYYDSIMKILLSNNEQAIRELLNACDSGQDIIFPINKLDTGKYDVTIGFNAYGEDICSKDFDTHLDAYKFSAIRVLLGYKLLSY